MTDKEKLQSLFDAALKDSSEITPKPPKQAFPTSPVHATAAVAPQVATESPQPIAAAPMPVSEAPQAGEATAPAGQSKQACGVLDDAASAELAAVLDERYARQKRRRRISAVITAVVFVVTGGGGSAWFVQSPERMQALGEVMQDFRSVTDVKGLVAKYQDALNRVSARSQQIDQATAAMGIKPSQGDEEDPYFEAEMSEMMGSEGGKTVGQRNKALQDNFSHMEKKDGKALANAAPLNEEESFGWSN